MRLDRPFLQLPLFFDADALAQELSKISEDNWRPHPEGFAGNAALSLIAIDGDPNNDGVVGPMRPTPHLQQLPYLRQVLASFGSVLGRTRLMRLDGNSEVQEHSDVNYYWQDRVRIHVPVLTTPGVRFHCGDANVHMAAGECWIFDTARRHRVLNPDATRRIHLVADTVGSAHFVSLAANGRDPLAANVENWKSQQIAFQPDIDPSLVFESVNQSTVMSPWELNARLEAVLAPLIMTTGDNTLAAELRNALIIFMMEWRGLWARFGEAAEGHTHYAALLQQIAQALNGFRGRGQLEKLDIVEWLEHTMLKPALAPPLTPAHSTLQMPVQARIDRPVFIVCPPRSGSSLLFETLARAPGVYSIGGESHLLIEGMPELHPANHNYDSNRLLAKDATAETVDTLMQRLDAQLRDRDGNPPAAEARGLRLLEKTPKNALRVPFLAQAFPDARFIYLYRDPRETLSSMLDAWRSERFITYPDLPGWPGSAWSLLLTPGWRELVGKPLENIVAAQWSATVTQLLDDVEALPPDRWCVASYDRLVADPQSEIARLCDFCELNFDQALNIPLPLSRYTLSSPDPDKWRHNATELERVLPEITSVAQRAREVFARPPAIRPPRRRSPTETPRPMVIAPAANAFRSVYSNAFPALLEQLGITLLVSTYQSGRVIVVRADEGKLNTHLRGFQSPMGIALGRRALAIGTSQQILEYRNQPAVGQKLDPPGKHDACFLPRAVHVTGDIRVHELAFDAEDVLWAVNTRFSCLCTLDAEHSFVPRWRPQFVSRLAAEDRCHLNGLALKDGRVRYVSALGTTDTPQGWRDNKASGGVLIDLHGGEIIAAGLSMPHSPRVYNDRLWVLESGKGEVNTIDLKTGRTEKIAELPGFTRGLTFAGPYAFIGLSQVRESVFEGLPLSERLNEKVCGVWVVDIRNGEIVAFLRFEGQVQEIFDVQILPFRYPELAEPDAEIIAHAFVLPDAALVDVG